MTTSISEYFTSIKAKLIWLICLAFALFHVYTAITGSLEALYQRSVHFMFACFLVFLMKPLNLKKLKLVGNIADIALMACAVLPVVYLIISRKKFMTRFFYVGALEWYEYLLCAMLIVAILEGTRRKMGLALPIIALCAIGYMLYGQHLPGVFGHSGFTKIQFVDVLYLTTEGIFGVALGASATFVVLFVVFGSFLEGSGVGEYFINFATNLTRKSIGGTAKAAVVSSLLFGSISGSAIANVATTGQVTIPLMKKTGYKPTFAAAVEAVASTGGQIMPPVMGSAVFIMAEITSIPYIKILVYAIIPALLYYLAVYVQVHLEAIKIGILPNKEEADPNYLEMFKKCYLFLPLVLLVSVLIMGYSPTRAVMISLVSIIGISMFDSKNRMLPMRICHCLVDGAKGVVSVAMACACAGIVVGVINYTGLGTRLSSLLLLVSQNNLLLALILTAVTSLILGMGLPTTPAYIVVATLMAPAIVQMGVPVAAAHLFAFYFACISAITPPVALASYTAAGIAECDPMKTGYRAFTLGVASYIVPFMFVFEPALILLSDDIVKIITSTITATIGVIALAVAMGGFLFKHLTMTQRTVMFLGSLGLIHSGLLTDIIGIGAIAAIAVPQYISHRSEKALRPA